MARCGFLRADEMRHVELVAIGQRRAHESRIDQVDAEVARPQVEIERLREVDERSLGSAVDQRLWQTAVARHACDDADRAVSLREQRRQDRGDRCDRCVQVGLEAARARLASVSSHARISSMRAGDDEHEVDAAPRSLARATTRLASRPDREVERLDKRVRVDARRDLRQLVRRPRRHATRAPAASSMRAPLPRRCRSTRR